MIPDEVKAQVEKLSARLAELEAEETRVGLQALELIKPYLTTPEGCEAALDIAPPGYVSFCVRRAQYALEEAKG